MVVDRQLQERRRAARDQVVMIDLGSDGHVTARLAAPTATTPACFNWAFDTYIRDVDFSPDGSYFVDRRHRRRQRRTRCATPRRASRPARPGTDIQPTWVDYTGGDTLWSVAITGTAVYVGGHQRWLNNPHGARLRRRRRRAAPGHRRARPATTACRWPGTRAATRAAPGSTRCSRRRPGCGSAATPTTSATTSTSGRRSRSSRSPVAHRSRLDADRQPAGHRLPGRHAPRRGNGNVLYRVNAGGPADRRRRQRPGLGR